MDNLEKTSLGLDANVAAALSYLLGWVTGAAMLVIERQNRFVRFHALQSTIVFGGLCALWLVGTAIPFVGWIVLLIFYIQDSDAGANRFGPNPKTEFAAT